MKRSFGVLVIGLVLFGCAGYPDLNKSYKETLLDDMEPILTEADYDSLESMGDAADIDAFVNGFWVEED